MLAYMLEHGNENSHSKGSADNLELQVKKVTTRSSPNSFKVVSQMLKLSSDCLLTGVRLRHQDP